MSAYYLAYGCSSPALALSGVRQVDGQPVQRFRKELIRVDQYTHPTDKVRFVVNPATLDHWVATFNRMKENGVKVPIPCGHTSDADKNRGYVEDLVVDGESLYMICDLIGEDGIKLAGRSDVSLYSPPSYEDGKGNKYERPIVHVAICTDPVIPGLGEWESIAASLGQSSVEFLQLKKEESTVNWNKIQAALKIKEPLTDDSAETLVLAALGTLSEQAVTLQKKFDEQTVALKLSTAKKEIDPILLKLAAENRAMKLDGLVAAGRITPAVKDKLVEHFVEAKVLELSLTSGVDDKFDDLVLILAENDPVKLREQTGLQVLRLMHGTGLGESDGESELVKNAKERAKVAAK